MCQDDLLSFDMSRGEAQRFSLRLVLVVGFMGLGFGALGV